MLAKKILTALIFTVSAVLFLFFLQKGLQPKKPAETTAAVAKIQKFGIPIQINIPAIALTAAIEQVGIAPDGSMDVPKAAMDTAWYKLGPRPGEIGNAVIDGHVDWINGGQAVFKNLHELKPGDKIIITDDQGQLVSFLVTNIKILPENANDTQIFIASDGHAHLNLITCGGVWDKNIQSYSQRLVIFADKK